MPRIKALLDFARTAPGNLLTRANAVYAALHDSKEYTRLPVDLAELRGQIDDFSDSAAAAMDGGKQAIADRNRKADILVGSLLLLAHHAEAHCRNDMKTFIASGFQPAPNSRTKTPPLSETIRKIVHGENSGQLKLTLIAKSEAFSYELRWAPFSDTISPDQWITKPIVKTRPATLISSLNPGTIYAFQVRMLTESGYTDWSDSVTKMCT
jgi:hypothetical protein